MSGPVRRPQPTFRHERLVVFDPAAPPPPAMAAFGLTTRLLALWRGWAAGRPAPERADIDPLAMPPLLPYLLLLDAVDGDFRFRLVGEAVNARYRHRLKGRTLRELMAGAALDETLYEHRRCAEDLAGVFVYNGPGLATLDDLGLYARLLLPVAADGGRARHLIGVMEFCGDPDSGPDGRFA